MKPLGIVGLVIVAFALGGLFGLAERGRRTEMQRIWMSVAECSATPDDCMVPTPDNAPIIWCPYTDHHPVARQAANHTWQFPNCRQVWPR
jgi:hypothetical protein